MISVAEAPAPFPSPEDIYLKPEKIQAARTVHDARAAFLAQEVFSRVELDGELVIDPPNVKCPENAIGATALTDDDSSFELRASAPEIGAIFGIGEQALILQALMAHIHEGKEKRGTGISLLRKCAGYNVGDRIPSLTVVASVSDGAISNMDIVRSVITPILLPWRPVNDLREMPAFRTCAQAAQAYSRAVYNSPDLPRMTRPPERAKPGDVVTVFSHFGNSISTLLRREMGIPTLIDAGIEYTFGRRRKFYRALYDLDDDNTPRGRNLVPCRSFAAWINQAILSTYLETGRPPLSNRDIRDIAAWVNAESLRVRGDMPPLGS